jgi:hypothetical protein
MVITKGATVEPSEFEGLLASLDATIDRTKKNKRGDELGAELRTLATRLGAVDARLEELSKAGGKPDKKAIEAIEAMRKRKIEVEAELVTLFPTLPREAPTKALIQRPVQSAVRLTDEECQEVELIISSLDGAPDVLDREDALYLMEEASIRWRLVAESIGNPDPAPGLLRKAYARIMEFREKRGLMQLRLDALLRSIVRDWNDDLSRVRRVAQEAAERRRAAIETTVDGVGQAMSKYITTKDAEDRRIFVHVVRDAAKNVDLRDEIAVICRIVKDELVTEGFGFLWESGKEQEDEIQEKTAMTRLEIAQRLLRRMINKGVIGGKHAPREMLWRGFPKGTAEGLAVELIETLERAGAIRTKNSGYGKRSAIEPAWVPKAQRLLAGMKSGTTAVDDWCFA